MMSNFEKKKKILFLAYASSNKGYLTKEDLKYVLKDLTGKVGDYYPEEKQNEVINESLAYFSDEEDSKEVMTYKSFDNMLTFFIEEKGLEL